MNFNEWLRELVGEESDRTVAQKVGFAATTIPRQLKRGALTPQTVIALCRAYDRPAVTGLVETGYLQPWEAEEVSLDYALAKASDRQLLAQIENRLSAQADDLFRAADNPNVVQFDRSNTSTPGVPAEVDDDDLLAGINPEEHAAHPKTKPMETDHWT